MVFLPDLTMFQSGKPVVCPEDWQARREEILDLLCREIYGFSPAVLAPGRETIRHREPKCCSGHAVLESVDITVETEKGPFSFPMKLFLPKGQEKCPLFLLLNFRPDAYDMYYPAEEIIDHGFALAVIYYEDITTDDENWENGLAGCFTRPQNGTGYGKIGLWAWAASRALDALLSRPQIDEKHVAVIGHSRLGKTALWCAAQDPRLQYAISNDSGCAGAALEKVKQSPLSETTQVITEKRPHWFCENYQRYAGHPEKMPFDQHFLLSLIAPRFVCVGSASQDVWADPYGEQLCCVAASPAWKILGKQGYIGPETPAKVGDAFREGEIGYHLREGIHFLGRADWLEYMDFIRLHF